MLGVGDAGQYPVRYGPVKLSKVRLFTGLPRIGFGISTETKTQMQLKISLRHISWQ